MLYLCTMDRIKLTKREKHVLRALSSNNANALCEFDIPAINRLMTLGLVRAAFIEGHRLEAAELTTMGKQYLYDNPHLRNPIDWKFIVTTTLAAIAAAAAVAALFVACSLT